MCSIRPNLSIARATWQHSQMARHIVLYGLALALLAAVLQWVQYRYLVLSMPGEAALGFLALVFLALGIWLGIRLTPQRNGAGFRNNAKAVAALGLTRRECEVLGHLARGASNKEIARAMGVSPNTVKTHVANLYAKLEVTGRGKAVDAARALQVIP